MRRGTLAPLAQRSPDQKVGTSNLSALIVGHIANTTAARSLLWCACVPRGIRTRPHFSICNQNGYSSFAVACLPHLIAQRASEDIDGGVLTIRRHRLFQIICASVCVCVCVCVCVRVLIRFSDGRLALPLFIFPSKSLLASIRLSNFEFLKDP